MIQGWTTCCDVLQIVFLRLGALSCRLSTPLKYACNCSVKSNKCCFDLCCQAVTKSLFFKCSVSNSTDMLKVAYPFSKVQVCFTAAWD